jgi:hypothetical protein
MESAGKRRRRIRNLDGDEPTILSVTEETINETSSSAINTTTIIKKKRVKKNVIEDDESGEKRLRRYRASVPAGTKDRIKRALSQRMFLIDSKINSEVERSYKVLGSTGNVYDVDIGLIPKCSCPDFLKGNLCKHVVFVLCRVLHQEPKSALIYQNALLTSELREIFALSDSKGVLFNVQASISVKKAAAAASGDAVEEVEESAQPDRKPQGDCSICFEDMTGATEKTISCMTCKNFLHSVCLETWLRSAAMKSCPYCRSPWHQGSSACHSSSEGHEGYVNLASVAGMSSSRPYYPRRSYSDWWD